MASSPAWIEKLANEVAAEMSAMDLLAPIGCHHYYNKALRCWEISVFASRTETIGGEKDGQRLPSQFVLDLQALQDVLSSVVAFHWQALPAGPDDEVGAHISIEGTYDGHTVWLRILAAAPERFECGRRVLVYEDRLEDRW